MLNITSEYISWDCIKKHMTSLSFVSFDASENDSMPSINLGKQNIKFYFSCGIYKNTSAVKQISFDFPIEKIINTNILSKSELNEFKKAIENINDNCYIP